MGSIDMSKLEGIVEADDQDEDTARESRREKDKNAMNESKRGTRIVSP